MKRVAILIFTIITTISSFCQNYIQDGDRCFESGDYACAITNYTNAYQNTTGKDNQIAEIKLTRAKWCDDHLKNANIAFAAKNYSTAKEAYQKVLESNPKDSFAQSQILKCNNALNPTKLRKATTADLADIWNNKYGVQPQRRQNLINAGIDPDDAQKRINAGEGKPQEKDSKVTTLSLSKSTLYFSSNSSSVEKIIVYTNASTFSIPSGYIPTWCTVKTYNGYFTVTVSPNPNYSSRKDWFKVTAGNEEVRIFVEQSEKPSLSTQQPSSTKKQTSKKNDKKGFNSPKTNDTWGLTLGYTEQTIDNNSMDVILFGLKIEPLFKNGLGLNTGINILGYTKSNIIRNGIDAYALNIPLHLEYRLNFSKYFNIFSYGGIGFNSLPNKNFDNYFFPVTCEYGGGFRINHVQFNVGTSLFLWNLRNTKNIWKYKDTYQKSILSISYMF